MPQTYRNLNGRARALVELGAWLRTRGYSFVTPTPETHRRVNARAANARATELRGVFGWSRAFDPELLPRHVLGWLLEADALDSDHGGLLRSRVRFSSLEGELFVHSAYPTHAEKSVFFGPDTYRFSEFVTREVELIRAECSEPLRVVEVGCGSGAVGLVVARRLGVMLDRLVLSDVNEQALELAAVSAALAEIHADCVQSDVLAQLEGSFDLVIANPPYMHDASDRTYRNGGNQHGSELSVRIVRETLDRLKPGGSLLLYTGSAIIDGVDEVRSRLEPVLRARGVTPRYFEIDPDVFGDELDLPAYADVERIAAVGLVAQVPDTKSP